MQLIHRMIADCSMLAPANQVVLAAERREFLKRRWRGIAEDGSEFGFDLEARLTDGCLIFQKDGNDYIVRQLPEKVYEVLYENPAQAAHIAWKVGNLHLPAQILEHAILVLHDEAMTQLLAREKWAFTEPILIFTPMKSVAHL